MGKRPEARPKQGVRLASVTLKALRGAEATTLCGLRVLDDEYLEDLKNEEGQKVQPQWGWTLARPEGNLVRDTGDFLHDDLCTGASNRGDYGYALL